jgi:CheY-like chemotaxis protein
MSPLQRVAALSKNLPNASDTAAQAAAEKRVVLYIEDNLSNLMLIEQIVAEQPAIELLTAKEGRAGLNLARRHLPDLILLDLHLPDIAGWEVLAQLKAGEDTRHIPTVIISADATARQIDRLMSEGARAYLTKPLDIDRFVSAIREFAWPSAANDNFAAKKL